MSAKRAARSIPNDGITDTQIWFTTVHIRGAAFVLWQLVKLSFKLHRSYRIDGGSLAITWHSLGAGGGGGGGDESTSLRSSPQDLMALLVGSLTYPHHQQQLRIWHKQRAMTLCYAPAQRDARATQETLPSLPMPVASIIKHATRIIYNLAAQYYY